MEEKRTFGEFIKENKGKIILIVGGLAIGIGAVYLLTKRGDGNLLETVENLNPAELTEGISAIGDTVNLG